MPLKPHAEVHEASSEREASRAGASKQASQAWYENFPEAAASSHQLASPTTFAPQRFSGECCFSLAHLFQAQKCVNMLQNAYELTSRHQGNEQTEGTEKTLTRNSNIMTEAELEAPHATTATSSFINMSICCFYWPLCRSCGLAFWG